jgi:ElaB/YqjD/DUF883 family membrane-anchored ribosome-binding protein
MKKRTKTHETEFSELAELAHALMVATGNVGGTQVQRARKRLAAALERGRSAGEDMIDASTDMAEETLEDIRDRVNAGMDQCKDIYDDVHDDVLERAKAADHTVRDNPYQAIGIALGLGALAGFFLSCRNGRNRR